VSNVLRAGLLAAVLLLTVGCGGGESQSPSGARRALERYYAALASGDGRSACRLLTEARRRALDQPPGGCSKDVLREGAGLESPRDAGISRVRVDGDEATARVTTSQGHGAAEHSVLRVVRLRRTSGGWRIAG
jgi:hypothetical protein